MSVNTRRLRNLLIVVIILIFGFASLGNSLPAPVAQVIETRTATPPRPPLSNRNQCRGVQQALQQWIQGQKDNSKERVCGSLVLIDDYETGKTLIGISPCPGGGNPIIFQRRPRELLEYYDLRDVVITTGETIYSEKFGCVNRYITNFSTYYPMDRCTVCGKATPVVSGPEFVFLDTPTPGGPVLFPTATPIVLPGQGSPSPPPTETATPTVTAPPSPIASATPAPAIAAMLSPSTSATPTSGLPPRMASLLQPEQLEPSFDPDPMPFFWIIPAVSATLFLLAAVLIRSQFRRR